MNDLWDYRKHLHGLGQAHGLRAEPIHSTTRTWIICEEDNEKLLDVDMKNGCWWCPIDRTVGRETNVEMIVKLAHHVHEHGVTD